jgi:hypothetical protein
MPKLLCFALLWAVSCSSAGDRWWEFQALEKGKRGERRGDPLLDRVITAAQERHLSQNTRPRTAELG